MFVSWCPARHQHFTVGSANNLLSLDLGRTSLPPLQRLSALLFKCKNKDIIKNTADNIVRLRKSQGQEIEKRQK